MSKIISEMAYFFLEEAYQDAVQELLDDPDGCSCNDPTLLIEGFNNLTALGEELKHSFWDVAQKVGTDYEIKYLKQMLLKAGVEIK